MHDTSTLVSNYQTIWWYRHSIDGPTVGEMIHMASAWFSKMPYFLSSATFSMASPAVLLYKYDELKQLRQALLSISYTTSTEISCLCNFSSSNLLINQGLAVLQFLLTLINVEYKNFPMLLMHLSQLCLAYVLIFCRQKDKGPFLSSYYFAKHLEYKKP